MALRGKFLVPIVLQQYQQLARASSSSRNKREENGCHRSKSKPSPITAEAAANAYEVLGLPENCKESSIRATFRKLAKATHPDLQTDTSTAHFIRILAAYEILSDPVKRAEYDKHLKSQKLHQSGMYVAQTHSTSGCGSVGLNNSELYEQETVANNTEVVSWLRSYRVMIHNIIHRREIGAGDELAEDFQGEVKSALKKAYFGPPVSERQGVPECFEAEERAEQGIQDVLHLVSGRQLFGVVRQVQNLSLKETGAAHFLQESIASKSQSDLRVPEMFSTQGISSGDVTSALTGRCLFSRSSDVSEAAVHQAAEGVAYVDLELQLFGNVVARSIRMPFEHDDSSDTSVSGKMENHDCIYIYLSSEQIEDTSEFANGTVADENKFNQILLGTIRGLSATGSRNSCFACNPNGKKTHLILQHTTPMVRHMQWFRIGEGSAPCECRCRRALALPSRYWLFEPRTDTHNVGGWYIETFGKPRRNPKRSNFGQGPLSRHNPIWRTKEESDSMDDTLHPAMYIIAAAYKTLDEENRAAQKSESSIFNKVMKVVDLNKFTFNFARWWKHKWNP